MKKITGYMSMVLGFLFTAISHGNAQSYKTMSVTSVDSLINADTTVIVLDVRTPEEFASASGHLRHAKLIPVQELGKRVSELTAYKGRTIVVYCLMGSRSAKASKVLSANGYDVINMQGGIAAWNGKGLPTEKGQAR